MYYLTENTIEMEGRTLTQIKKILDGKEIYGGYIDKELVHHPDVWVQENSYLIATVVKGKLWVDANVIIQNSVIVNQWHIRSGCRITDCILECPARYSSVIRKNVNMQNKHINGHGFFDEKFCNDGPIINSQFNGLHLCCTDHYCHVGCLEFSYAKAKQILETPELWEDYRQHYKKSPHIFQKDTKMWLQYWLDKQLKKIEH